MRRGLFCGKCSLLALTSARRMMTSQYLVERTASLVNATLHTVVQVYFILKEPFGCGSIERKAEQHALHLS